MGLEEEIRELEKRFAESPDSRLFLPLADALRRAGELERAMKLCREGLERFPDFASARVLLGECLAESGDLEQAEQTLQKLVEEDGENIRVLKGLAALAEQKGAGDKAQALYEQVGKLGAVEPEEDTLPEEEPLAGEQAGQPEPLAENSARQPLEDDNKAAPAQGPGELFITHTLADIYRLQGHYEQAYEIYSKLVESEKEDTELIRKLEDVSSHLGGEPNLAPAPVEAGVTDRESSAQEAAPEAEPGAPKIQVGAGLNDRFEERINRIFRFLLGDDSGSSVEA